MSKKYLVAGATGLIGTTLVNQIPLNEDVTVIARRKINYKRPVNFLNLDECIKLPHADHLFICLGYPLELRDLLLMRKSIKAKFKAVDYNLVIKIAEAKKNHGDKYDYSQVNYVNSKTKVIIICSKHGEFNQLPSSHLMGAGCKKCATEVPHNKLDIEQFIKRSKKIFGKRFDYSKAIYKDIKSDITLICPIHGEFDTNVDNHLASQISGGCKVCRYEAVAKSLSLSKKEFVIKAKEVWGNKWSYSNAKYISGNKKIAITCSEHGDFFQLPYSHLNGNGCPKCNYKKEGRIAEYLHSKFIVHREYKIKNKRYDFYLPEFNLIIERDGEQHYGTRTFANLVGMDKDLYNAKEHANDIYKTQLAKEQGLKIARIPYWLTKKEEEIEIENILAGKPTYPDVPDVKQEKTKPKPRRLHK